MGIAKITVYSYRDDLIRGLDRRKGQIDFSIMIPFR